MGFMDFFKRKSSGDVAKDRLKLLLVSDRANCSPDVMELIKNDIIKVISKYMEIDAEGLVSRLPRQNLIQEMEPFRRCMRIFRFVICIIHRRKRKKNKSRLKVQSKMGAVSLNALQSHFQGVIPGDGLFYLDRKLR